MRRILVWDIPVRVFHWLLTLGFFTAFGVAEFAGKRSALFPFHMMLGLVLALMVVLRLIWGVTGTRYARLGGLLFAPGELLAYIKGAFTGTARRYTGHNPGSAWAIIAILILVPGVATAGWLTGAGYKSFEEVHTVAAWTLLAVVGVHILGVIMHTLRHRENITASMLTGRKQADEADPPIPSSRPVAGIVFVLLVALFAGDLYRHYDPSSRTTKLPLLGTSIHLGNTPRDRRPPTGSREHHDDD